MNKKRTFSSVIGLRLPLICLLLLTSAINGQRLRDRLLGGAATRPTGGASAKTNNAEFGYDYKPGPMEIASANVSWHDAKRDRDVPVRIFAPKLGGASAATQPVEADAKLPLVVFSPGLGGSREVYGYFAKHLASYGYFVIVVTHKGTDTDYLLHNGARALFATLSNEKDWSDRAADISFVIDRALDKAQDEPLLKGRVNSDQIGVAGHSYGAFTSLAIAGQISTNKQGQTHPYADPRVKACITMCPQWIKAFGLDEHSWDKIEIPTMIMTGTRDPGMLGKAPQQNEIFPGMPKGEKYFLLLSGAGHMNFATNGKLFSKDDTEDPSSFHDWIDQCGVAFFDAYLRNDAKAKAWLKDGKIAKASGGHASIQAR